MTRRGQSSALLPLSVVELPQMIPIEYRGELVALVSARRTHIVSPRLLAAQAGDADLMFVALLCACCSEVLNGRLPGPYTAELGEFWARRALEAIGVVPKP